MIIDSIDYIFFLAIIIFLGTIISLPISKILKHDSTDTQLIIGSLIYRSMLTAFYASYFVVADARLYYEYAHTYPFSLNGLFVPGTSSTIQLATFFYPFASLFNAEYLMLYIPFSLLGHIGSILFYDACKRIYCSDKKTPALLSLFLPNLVFWTSNLGKDSIVFLGISLIINSLINHDKTRSIIQIITGIFIVYMIRPHAAALLLFAIFAGGVFQIRTVKLNGIIIVFVASLMFALFYEKAFEFVGIRLESETIFSTEGVSEVYDQSITDMERRAGGLGDGGSSTKTSPFSIIKAPLYIIGFIGGPFLWQVSKPIHLMGAVESIIYQYIMLYIAINWRIYSKSTIIPFKYSLLIYILLSSMVMGITFANFGLTIRQKCMIIPTLVIIYLTVKQSKNESLSDTSIYEEE